MTTKTTFWQEYLKRIDKNTPSSTLQQYEKIMVQGKKQFEEAIETFRFTLSEIPLGAEIANWLERLDLPKEYISKYTESTLNLIDLKLLSLTNRQGQLRTLNDVSPNDHRDTIEEIRCSSKLSIPEKEKAVEAYILFSQHLSRATCGLIMQGEDPDFQRTIKKVVWYKNFIKFVQLLPERDALIAKLLYFGAPTMDEVLSLRVDQIDSRKGLVKFKKFSVKYPKHVMLELKNSLGQKKKEDLIFTNLHGQQVERTHLNNCFNRAARKLDGNIRITPKMLLEEDVEKGAASNCVFAHLSI
jgi:site-specific recombinase XerD